MFKFRLIAILLLGGALALGVAPVDAARDKNEKADGLDVPGFDRFNQFIQR